MTTNYELALRHAGVAGFLRVNGVPLSQWSGAREQGRPLPVAVTQWLRPDDNRLAALVHDCVDPLGVSGLRLLTVALAGESDGAELLEWSHRGGLAPTLLETRFRVRRAPPFRLWQDAEPIELSDAIERQATDRAVALHTVLQTRDVEALISARAYVLREGAIAAGMQAQWSDYIARVRMFYRDVFEDPEYPVSVAPLAREALRVQLVGDGRLLWITHGDTAPPLALRPDEPDPDGLDLEVPFPLYLASIGGQLTWVR